MVMMVLESRHDEAAMWEKLAARLAMNRFSTPLGVRQR
jgi:hypothetical protein